MHKKVYRWVKGRVEKELESSGDKLKDDSFVPEKGFIVDRRE